MDILTLAIVANGVVTNVVLGTQADFPGAVDVSGLSPRPSQGWLYDGETFTPPAAPPAPDYGTRVTKLAFRQRIGQQALVAIELAAIHNPAGTLQQQQLAASLRVMLEDVRVATFIDLARPDTRAGVQQLETAGLIPAGKAAEILDTPVQPHEVPIGV